MAKIREQWASSLRLDNPFGGILVLEEHEVSVASVLASQQQRLDAVRACPTYCWMG
jgi:hypothetical protein